MMEKILLINICKEKLHYYEFVKPIENILRKENKEFFIKNYKDVQQKDLEECSKVIICGTSLKDNEFLDSVNRRFWNWIKDFSKPLLGICGGMQIIGLIFGGRFGQKTEIGFYKEHFEANFLGLFEQQEVYHLHNNFVDFSRLSEFEIYCINPEKIVQAVKHRQKELYGVLFHPEVRNKSLITNFLCQIKK